MDNFYQQTIKQQKDELHLLRAKVSFLTETIHALRKDIAQLDLSEYHKQRGRSQTFAYNCRWNELARAEGFKDEREMFECLSKEWSVTAIGDLLGYHRATVLRRMDTLGIPTAHVKRRGYGKNYQKEV